MLSTLTDDPVTFQPDEALRILDRHFNGGVVDPCCWEIEINGWRSTHASTSGDHKVECREEQGFRERA